MHPDDDQLADHRIVAEQSFFQRATYWLWNPWYAKLLWALSGLYWLGLYAMMLEPDWLSNSLAGAMILLVFLFNPITVIAILGRGWVKANVAHGDWIFVPGSPLEIVERQRREREEAYINPADARSGYMHQQYLEKSKRHATSHDGL